MDNFSSFCNSTSLHGWPHVPSARTLERLFWLLTIALMLVLAASFCSRYRKGFPFLQVFSLCLWKWTFFAKKIITLDFCIGQVNFPFQYFDRVPDINSINESDLLYRVCRPSEVSQDCYLQQISAQVKILIIYSAKNALFWFWEGWTQQRTNQNQEVTQPFQH